jgi:GNAT superfamily N-acetyltransferase
MKQHLHNYNGFSIGIQSPIPQSIIEQANQWMGNNPFFADLQFSSCVVAKANDNVVGAIIFAKEQSTIIGGTMQIHMRIQAGYVIPSARKQGLYKHLHKTVETIAKGLGCVDIISRVNADNTEMLSMLNSLGKTIDHHIVVKKLG